MATDTEHFVYSPVPAPEPDAPVRVHFLDIELTERCQNRCVHCYINRRLDDPCRDAELDTAAWQDLIRQGAALGLLTVRLTGGEPLIRDDFATLYEFIRRQGITVRLSTNARALTPALADLLARIPPLKQVEVTVYGMSAASYDAVAGVGGAHAEFERGVARLLERRIPFVPSYVLLPANRHEVDAFQAWAAALPDPVANPTITTHLDLRVRRDAPDANARIDALRMAPEARVAFLRRDPHYRWQMQDFCRKFMAPVGECLFNCGALTGGSLDAYGFLQPCLSVRHPDFIVDARQQSLRDALVALRARLRAARSAAPAFLARCARCFLHGLCEMCPGKAWPAHGTLDTPDEYFCALAHAQARDLGLLDDGERAWEITDTAARLARLTDEKECV